MQEIALGIVNSVLVRGTVAILHLVARHVAPTVVKFVDYVDACGSCLVIFFQHQLTRQYKELSEHTI